jgi:VCBS repeat-containing protein
VSAIDLMGNAIGYALDGSAPAGVTFNADGTFTFDPKSAYKYLGVGESTSPSFQFTASDGQGTDSAATETITIHGLNDNPTATPDSNGVAKGSDISVSAAHGLLANDSDPDIHDHLTVGLVDGSAANVGSTIQGKYGSLIVSTDGSYVYKADHGSLPSQIVAQDNFTYGVSDGHGGVSTSTLSVLVFNPSTNYQSGANTTLVSNGIQPNVLDGSAGHDVLIGGIYADVLVGGSGDKLTGGGGPDTFVFRPNFGANTITDFNVNNSAMQFDKTLFTSVSDVLAHTTDTAHGAVISDAHGDSVTLIGVTLAQLHAHQTDFHLV